MEFITNYLLESSICIAVFYTFYFLVLKPLTSFQWNRFYLILSLLLSCLIPLMSFNIFPIYYDASLLQEVTTVSNQLVAEGIKSTFVSTSFILISLYAAVALFFLIRLLYNSFLILNQIRKSEKLNKGKYTIVLNKDETKVYSFFNFLITPKKENLDAFVLKHELTHIKQKHSLDIIISEILKAVLWFNPFSYLVQKAIKLNHEYICDHYASKVKDNYQYAKYLALVNHKEYRLSLVNNFAYKLKNRIIMLQKSDGSQNQKWRYFLTLPLICCVFSLFSFEEYYVPVNNENALIQIDTLPPTKIITVVDTTVVFDFDTNEESMQIVKSEQEVVEVTDTITIFDYDTYEESVQVVKRTVPIDEYLEEMKQYEIQKNKAKEKRLSDDYIEVYDTITVFDTKTYEESISIVKRLVPKDSANLKIESRQEASEAIGSKRKIVHRNYKPIALLGMENQDGKIVTVNICFNKKGIINYAELLDKKTTAFIPDKKQFLKAVYSYKLEPDPQAPNKECTEIKFTF